MKSFKYNYHKAVKQKLNKINKTIENYKYIYNYNAPKYLYFIKNHLEKGYTVKLYKGGQRGVSKYVFIENDTHLIKVRFSNHKPIKEREQKEDCDFYVGISHKQVSTTEEITKKIEKLTSLTEVLPTRTEKLIQVTPHIAQSLEDYEANMAFDEARDNALMDEEGHTETDYDEVH